mmetsp:Transcript_26869/g.38117  ORF Transcript_26869/g.38117 Transcript_26869/m.38117 type:complete len:82 (-) Transcript_26869:1333-1578(-)
MVISSLFLRVCKMFNWTEERLANWRCLCVSMVDLYCVVNTRIIPSVKGSVGGIFLLDGWTKVFVAVEYDDIVIVFEVRETL